MKLKVCRAKYTLILSWKLVYVRCKTIFAIPINIKILWLKSLDRFRIKNHVNELMTEPCRPEDIFWFYLPQSSHTSVRWKVINSTRWRILDWQSVNENNEKNRGNVYAMWKKPIKRRTLTLCVKKSYRKTCNFRINEFTYFDVIRAQQWNITEKTARLKTEIKSEAADIEYFSFLLFSQFFSIIFSKKNPHISSVSLLFR